MYFDYELLISAVYSECSQNGSYQELPREMTFEFMYLDSSSQPVSSVMEKGENQTQVVYKVEKFSLEGNRSYDLNVRAVLSNNSIISSELKISIFIEKSELLALIEGGNRQNGYEDELKVQGVVKDLDVEESLQSDGIGIAWRCEDLMSQNQPCKNIKNEVLEVNQSGLSQRYQPRLIQPYTALKFILEGEKVSVNKSKETSAIIIIVELSTIPLIVQYPK